MDDALRLVTAYHTSGPHPEWDQSPGWAVCNTGRLGERPSGFAAYDDNQPLAERNVRYCELSAMRAGFKDAPEPYLGLQHYRRFFLTKAPRGTAWRPDVYDIPFWDWNDVGRYGADMESLLSAVGAYDYCTAPRIDQRPDGHESLLLQFKSRHPSYFIDALDEAIHDTDRQLPSISEYLRRSYKASFFNMFVATNAAANRYSDFLWPILARCEQIIGDPEDAYQSRYAGFLAERLQSYWADLIAPRYGFRIGEIPIGFAPSKAIVNLRHASSLKRAVVVGQLIARPVIDQHLPNTLRGPLARIMASRPAT